MLGFSSPPAWLLVEPTGFRMLHMDGKPGPAPGLAGFCHRAGPGVWLGSLHTWQLCSWLQHILVGEAGLDVVCPLFPCSRQKGQKQAAKIRPSICLAGGQVVSWNMAPVISGLWQRERWGRNQLYHPALPAQWTSTTQEPGC